MTGRFARKDGGYNLNGAPPEGHPRQCKTRMKRHGGRRCRKWALQGKDYCAFHQGRPNAVPLGHLPVFYSQRLSGTLQSEIEEQLARPIDEHVSLLEELAIMRSMATRALLLYEAAVKANKSIEEATVVGMSALSHVRDMCMAASRVDATQSGFVSLHSLRVILDQIVRLFYDVCGDEHQDLAALFEQRIHTEVKLPSRDSDGTTITPDQDVLDMDLTIPGSE